MQAKTSALCLLVVSLQLVVPAIPALAADGLSATNNPQCPLLPTFIAKLTSDVPDLGGGRIFDESTAPVEPLGSRECPTHSATQCERLAYLSFMFGLLSMSPQYYRRPGLASFLANVGSEDASFGSQCSAENIAYTGDNIRAQFPSLSSRFCSPAGLGFATGKAAGVVEAGNQCDTSDAGLAKLNAQIIAENPSLAKRPGYNARFTAIVARMYRYNTSADSDDDGFLFRGRGFIQVTGKENYQACQRDIAAAEKYLAANPIMAQTIQRATGLDWRGIDILKTPEAVSQNQYLAAVCAASYWKDHSAKPELIWPKNSTNFGAIVASINKDSRKIKERLPSFTRWCAVVGCSANYPPALDFAAGFGTLARLAKSGAVTQ